MNKRIILDILMIVLFLVIMDYHFTKNVIHESLAMLWLVVFLIHMKWNLGWFKGLLKGKWNTFRISVTVIDSIILFSFIGSMVTGILLSKYFFPGYFSKELIHSLHVPQLHHMLPRVLMIAIGLHLGLHWQVWWNKFKNIACIISENSKYKTICYIIIAVIIFMGIEASFTYRVGDRLLMVPMKHFNRTVNTELLTFSVWHGAIIGLWAIISHYFHKWIKSIKIK